MERFTEFVSKWFASVIGQLGNVEITDIIDIFLLSLIFFFAYRFIRDRRAGKLAGGVLIVFVLLAFAEILNMHAMQFLLQNFFQVGLIALIILFQPELRAALEKMGGEPLKSLKSIGEQKDMAQITSAVDNICEAVSDMSRKKTGALIVIEQGTKLGDIIRSGVEIDANINAYMIRNIFFNKAPLHDGAMIIRNYRICAAGCFLPLSQNEDIDQDLGTRHRAAIGMSEVSDAIIIVVSEETGTISLVRNGKFVRGYNYQTLKQELISKLTAKDSVMRGIKRFRREDADKSGE